MFLDIYQIKEIQKANENYENEHWHQYNCPIIKNKKTLRARIG